MNENVKHLKYLVEVETPFDDLMKVNETLRTLPFVKGMTLVDSNVTLQDVFAKHYWPVDGLKYQNDSRNEWDQ